MANTINFIVNTFSNIILGVSIISVFIISFQTAPIYGTFSFIGVTATVAFYLILQGAEFLALLILIIYTGVISVLFIFTILIYNLWATPQTFFLFLINPIFIVLSIKSVWFGSVVVSGLKIELTQQKFITQVYTGDIGYLHTLFSEHFIIFLISGLLLLIAMLGSVLITDDSVTILKKFVKK